MDTDTTAAKPQPQGTTGEPQPDSVPRLKYEQD
jgi:hypothetical protein